MAFYLLLGFVLALIAMVLSSLALAGIALGLTTYSTGAQAQYAIAIISGGMVLGAIILGVLTITAICSSWSAITGRIRKTSVLRAYIYCTTNNRRNPDDK